MIVAVLVIAMFVALRVLPMAFRASKLISQALLFVIMRSIKEKLSCVRKAFNVYANVS